MSRRRVLAVESLEGRQLLSAGALSSRLASAATPPSAEPVARPALVAAPPALVLATVENAAPSPGLDRAAIDEAFEIDFTAPPSATPGKVTETPATAIENAPSPIASPAPSVSQDVPSSPLWWRQFYMSSTPAKWDWVAGTDWYVPADNLLAYTMQRDLTDATPVADQTLWHVERSYGGIITGTAVTQLSSLPIVEHKKLTGFVSPEGQIRVEFTHYDDSAITGIGQMRVKDGAWTMEMQMVSSGNTALAHWAYMTQATSATTPSEPAEPPQGSDESNGWRWLVGTQWSLADEELFGGDAIRGEFELTSFRSGYFFGAGISDGLQPMNIFGSVTPEGNLMFLVSIDGADFVARAGQLLGDSSGASMVLRSYDSSPSAGLARLING